MILAVSTLGTIVATVIAFLVLTIGLVGLLLFVKQKLSPSGPVKILINGEREVEVASGDSLLSLARIARSFTLFAKPSKLYWSAL